MPTILRFMPKSVRKHWSYLSLTLWTKFDRDFDQRLDSNIDCAYGWVLRLYTNIDWVIRNLSENIPESTSILTKYEVFWVSVYPSSVEFLAQRAATQHFLPTLKKVSARNMKQFQLPHRLRTKTYNTFTSTNFENLIAYIHICKERHTFFKILYSSRESRFLVLTFLRSAP